MDKFIIFAQEGNFDILFDIFNKPGYNISDSQLRNALFWAARNGHSKVVELLILNGADINYTYHRYNHLGHTYISNITKIAVLSNDINTVKTLIEYKSDINYSNPRIAATMYGNIEIMEYLLSKKADINAEQHGSCIPGGIFYNPITYNNTDAILPDGHSKLSANLGPFLCPISA
jgi:ankyrin repeat protein